MVLMKGGADVWEARAEYMDGTSVSRLFEQSPYKTESEQQYELEEWLITRKDGCIWYSVNWVEED